MDAPAANRPIKYNRWLPYWAVLQADIWQTFNSWLYRVWVLVSVLVGVGYLLYRVGLYQEAGIVQEASSLMYDLLRWTVLGSVTLIIMMTVSAISSDRGTVADSILSRGISRYQFFLAKWHSRLAIILGTYLVMAIVALTGSYFLLHEDLNLIGSVIALLTVTALLATVISCGVTVSAITNSTVLGIAVLWIVLYGLGFALAFLPEQIPSPDRILNRLQFVLRGYYNVESLARLMGWSGLASCLVALVGMIWFSRRDV